MRFEKQIQGGRAFMEFAKAGDGRMKLTRRGFSARYRASGLNPSQPQMATESPLIHDGSQNVLSTVTDFRNSTLTGSTLAGPSGSGQFLAVYLSTGRTVGLMTSTIPNVYATPFYGICQNKPRPGDAVDIGIFGVSKVVSGSSSIVGGGLLQVSSTTSGVLVPYSSGTNGRPVGMAIENATAVGQVFTAFIGGIQAAGSS